MRLFFAHKFHEAYCNIKKLLKIKFIRKNVFQPAGVLIISTLPC